MSECKWCDTCQRPFPDSDIDSQAIQVPIPKVENGRKVGVAYTVEQHRCGDCVRTERAAVERRLSITAHAEPAPADDAPADDAPAAVPEEGDYVGVHR